MSEMSRHTPGPWVARPDPNACQTDDWCVGIGDSIANIDKVAVCSERDARLIAAAPELLEFAEWVLSLTLNTGGMIEGRARAAIAKATGGRN